MSQPYVAMGDRTGPDSQHALPSQIHTTGVIIGGHGSPEGVVPGVPGQLYEDNDTGHIWQKIASTGVNGWQQVGIKAS